MSSQTLAQLVRAKYPGVYDDLDDADLDRRIRSKYPGVYDDIPGMGTDVPDRGTVRPIPPSRGPLGGPDATMSAGEPEGALSRGYGAVKEAVFGHPDRAEAQAAGIGLQPTLADLGRTAVGLGAAGLAGGGMVRGAMALPGVAGAVARPIARAAGTPVGAGVAAGAGTLAAGGSLRDAAVMGMGTALGMRSPRGVASVAAKAVRPISKPKLVTPSAPKQTPKNAPAATAKPAAKATEAPAKVPSRGAEVAARHNELMAFGKKIAADDPKVGEKIWILLDEAGKPIRRLTSDEAGAAARKGLRTTWVKNLWTAAK